MAALALSPIQGFSAESPSAVQIRELKALIEYQGKQIDLLTQQVVKMNMLLEQQHAAGGGKAAEPAAIAAPPTAAEPAKTEFAVPVEPQVAKAQAPNGTQKHVVVKGETLTSIAKSYSISLSELQKANKDVNPGKLQIGHTLNIPPAKPGETAAEKKETP